MPYSTNYNLNTAYREYMQSAVSRMLDWKQDGSLATRVHPSKNDPNWYSNIMKTYNIKGPIYSNDWIEEIKTQKKARGLP